MQNKQSPNDVYTIVTNCIIEHLEKGVIPWRQPWTEAGVPKNLISGKKYRGINVWLLSTLNYTKNQFLTFKQVQDLGASVKKGEKSQEVIFWKWMEKEDGIDKEGNAKIKKVPMLRYYKVFNIDQCEGIPKEKLPPVIERKNNPLETCEQIIKEMPKKPKIQHNEHRAYYHRKFDFINMPKMETFNNSEGYYGTLFHELVHSTGHEERLNRRELTQSKSFGSENYAIEELTAEMGASYLKSYTGIPIDQLENNASYIQNWLDVLKKDKKFIVYASSQAQKATDYILNIKNEEKELEYHNQDDETEKEIGRADELKNIRRKENTKSVEIEI